MEQNGARVQRELGWCKRRQTYFQDWMFERVSLWDTGV
jgi:hypothetical protein